MTGFDTVGDNTYIVPERERNYMNEREIKRNLNKHVKFTNRRLFIENADYILTGATIRRDESGFFYQAILQDVNNGNSVVVSKLEEIAAGEKGETT